MGKRISELTLESTPNSSATFPIEYNNTNYKVPVSFIYGRVPIGGTLGQVLAKKTLTDYDFEWVDQTATISSLEDTKVTITPAYTGNLVGVSTQKEVNDVVDTLSGLAQLTAPNGSVWEISVDNSGTLITTLVTPGSGSFLLLDDGTFYLLLDDGSSKIILE